MPKKGLSSGEILEAAERLVQEHPEINYIYITTSGSAPGVCRALEELERKKRVTVIAFDDNKENKRLMKEGSIDVLLCQESFRQGYDAINHMELLRACAYSAACAGVPYNLFFRLVFP